MAELKTKVTPHELRAAQEFFQPAKFGFQEHGNGWVKEFPGIGPVGFAPISWAHVQQTSFTDTSSGEPSAVNTLEFISRLQKTVWGMDDFDVVPPNTLAIIGDTGASTIVAYEMDRGFTPEGWLGLVIGFGSNNGTLVSHMLGVPEDLRGKADIGFNLKVLQSHAATQSGYDSMKWTYDPMRGVNARLNLEKLGGVVYTYTVDKYGSLVTKEYGAFPTDRYTVYMDLVARRTQDRIRAVNSGIYTPNQPNLMYEIPIVTEESVESTLEMLPESVLFEIPAELKPIGKQQEAIHRQEMRMVMSSLLNREAATFEQSQIVDPALIDINFIPGHYMVTGFATGPIEHYSRKSFYILEKK